jgi:hypothetical protein
MRKRYAAAADLSKPAGMAGAAIIVHNSASAAAPGAPPTKKQKTEAPRQPPTAEPRSPLTMIQAPSAGRVLGQAAPDLNGACAWCQSCALAWTRACTHMLCVQSMACACDVGRACLLVVVAHAIDCTHSMCLLVVVGNMLAGCRWPCMLAGCCLDVTLVYLLCVAGTGAHACIPKTATTMSVCLPSRTAPNSHRRRNLQVS